MMGPDFRFTVKISRQTEGSLYASFYVYCGKYDNCIYQTLLIHCA